MFMATAAANLCAALKKKRLAFFQNEKDGIGEKGRYNLSGEKRRRGQHSGEEERSRA